MTTKVLLIKSKSKKHFEFDLLADFDKKDKSITIESGSNERSVKKILKEVADTLPDKLFIRCINIKNKNIIPSISICNHGEEAKSIAPNFDVFGLRERISFNFTIRIERSKIQSLFINLPPMCDYTLFISTDLISHLPNYPKTQAQ